MSEAISLLWQILQTAIITEETISAYLKSPVRQTWWREANNRRGEKTGQITDSKNGKGRLFLPNLLSKTDTTFTVESVQLCWILLIAKI